VIVAAVADEDTAASEPEDRGEACRFDGAVVTEPTHLEVCLPHKGYQWIEWSRPAEPPTEAGSTRDRREFADGPFLARLDQLERALFGHGPGIRWLGPPSLTRRSSPVGAASAPTPVLASSRSNARTIPARPRRKS